MWNHYPRELKRFVNVHRYSPILKGSSIRSARCNSDPLCRRIYWYPRLSRKQSKIYIYIYTVSRDSTHRNYRYVNEMKTGTARGYTSRSSNVPRRLSHNSHVLLTRISTTLLGEMRVRITGTRQNYSTLRTNLPVETAFFFLPKWTWREVNLNSLFLSLQVLARVA